MNYNGCFCFWENWSHLVAHSCPDNPSSFAAQLHRNSCGQYAVNLRITFDYPTIDYKLASTFLESWQQFAAAIRKQLDIVSVKLLATFYSPNYIVFNLATSCHQLLRSSTNRRNVDVKLPAKRLFGCIV